MFILREPMGEHGARRKASKDLRRSERNSCLCGCFAKEEWCGAGGGGIGAQGVAYRIPEPSLLEKLGRSSCL